MNVAESVESNLVALGIETPMTERPEVNNDVKRQYIEENVANIMRVLGLDLDDDSLKETPKRVAKMYVDEIFSGLNYANFPKITCIDNKMKVDQMILCKQIDLNSTCEHHLITISGKAKVAYIPNGKVIGISKINRIVKFFAKRPQVQERLTQQIAETLKFLLGTDDVAVQIEATHFCVKSRGVEDGSSATTTISVNGVFFSKPEARSEFLNA
jgi:GTP cyclohydrolase I